MVKNIKLRIKVEFVETEEEPSPNRYPQEQADGSFSLVLPEADELNISASGRAGASCGDSSRGQVAQWARVGG